jgi:hypothetical protein
MDDRSVATLSTKFGLDALQTYRQSAGRRTSEMVRQLKPGAVHQKVEAPRVQKVIDEGALVPEAIKIANYWSKRTIGGLLLMPPTRQKFLDLNEAMRIKQKLERVK